MENLDLRLLLYRDCRGCRKVKPLIIGVIRDTATDSRAKIEQH